MSNGIGKNPLNDISKVYLEQVGKKKKKDDSYLETDMKKRQENNEKAREDMKKMGTSMKNPHFEQKQFGWDSVNSMTKAYRAMQEGIRDEDPEKGTEERKKRLEKKRGMKMDDHPQYAKEALDPVGKEDGDVNNDGKKDDTDSYLMKRRKAIGSAMKKRLKEERASLSEVMTDKEDEKKVVEKKVNNTVVISPKLSEAVEELGGEVLEMVELEEQPGPGYRPVPGNDAAGNRVRMGEKVPKGYKGGPLPKASANPRLRLAHTEYSDWRSDLQEGPYVVTNADKKGNTPAYQGLMKGAKNKVTGKPLYVAAPHLKLADSHELEGDMVEQSTASMGVGPKGTTVKMTATGKEPVGDKVLKTIQTRVGDFLQNINPKPLKSTRVEPRKPLVAIPKEEVNTQELGDDLQEIDVKGMVKGALKAGDKVMKTPVGKAVSDVLKPVGSGSGTARPSVRVQDRIRKNQAGMESVEVDGETIDERTRYAKETGKDPQTGKPSEKGGTRTGKSAFDQVSREMRKTGGVMSSRGKGIQPQGKKKEKGKKGYQGPTPVDRIRNRLSQKRKEQPNPYRTRAGESD